MPFHKMLRLNYVCTATNFQHTPVYFFSSTVIHLCVHTRRRPGCRTVRSFNFFCVYIQMRVVPPMGNSTTATVCSCSCRGCSGAASCKREGYYPLIPEFHRCGGSRKAGLPCLLWVCEWCSHGAVVRGLWSRFYWNAHRERETQAFFKSPPLKDMANPECTPERAAACSSYFRCSGHSRGPKFCPSPYRREAFYKDCTTMTLCAQTFRETPHRVCWTGLVAIESTIDKACRFCRRERDSSPRLRPIRSRQQK